MKFFHKRKPYTSNGCMFPVVPVGIVNRIIVSVDSNLVSCIIFGQ